MTISFNLAPGAALGDAVAAIDRVSNEMHAPLSLQGSFEGSAQAFQTSLSTEPYLIAAALAAVYIILGVLYESYILPLTILSTLPSAGVGALLMLMLARTDLSVIAMIGIILLIGIVKKNGIMMVDFAIHAERADGLLPTEAIRQACLLRFRPILMTTMAAMLSGLPLMLGTGAGSELRQPLGYAMVGGLLLSQVLTLYTTPVIYLYLDRLQHFLAPARRAAAPVGGCTRRGRRRLKPQREIQGGRVAFAQCTMKTGSVISASSARVTPPNASSRNREWPNMPHTSRSAPTSAA